MIDTFLRIWLLLSCTWSSILYNLRMGIEEVWNNRLLLRRFIVIGLLWPCLCFEILKYWSRMSISIAGGIYQAILVDINRWPYKVLRIILILISSISLFCLQVFFQQFGYCYLVSIHSFVKYFVFFFFNIIVIIFLLLLISYSLIHFRLLFIVVIILW